jgi:uncharacterized protein YjbI with pentapeptide repeats
MYFLRNLFTPQKSLLLGPKDINDTQSLILKLRNLSDPLSKHLASHFSADTNRLLQDAPPDDVGTTSLLPSLINALNDIMQRSTLYTSEVFANVSLSPDTQALLKQRRTGKNLLRLNRDLLRDYYTDEFARRPPTDLVYARLEEVMRLARQLNWPELHYRVLHQESSTQFTPSGARTTTKTTAPLSFIHHGRAAWYRWRQQPSGFSKVLLALRREDFLAALRSGIARKFLGEFGTGGDFCGLNFSGLDLTGIRWPEFFSLPPYFIGASFVGSNLSGNVVGSSFMEADFTRAILTGADLKHQMCYGASFREAVLEGADLRDADLTEADLRGTDLSTARLAGGMVVETRFLGARFDTHTKWPEGFNPIGAGAVRVDLRGMGVDRAEELREPLEERVKATVQDYSQRIKDDKVFFRPSIPAEKLRNAIEAYAHGVDPDEVLVLIDESFMGRKAGVVLSASMLYSRDLNKRVRQVAVAEIASVTFVPGTTSVVHINGSEFMSFGAGKEAVGLFCEMLRAMPH